jgi:hypothetical protein
MTDVRARTPAEILKPGLSCVSPTPLLKREEQPDGGLWSRMPITLAVPDRPTGTAKWRRFDRIVFFGHFAVRIRSPRQIEQPGRDAANFHAGIVAKSLPRVHILSPQLKREESLRRSFGRLPENSGGHAGGFRL